MKVIADLEKQTLRMLENERSIFRGEYGVDKLELYINKRLENEYPTITGLLSNGRKIGPYTTDDAYSIEVIDGVEYTKASFTLSKENGFTLSEGKMQITIWINNSNGRKEAIGNVTLNVINTTAFDDGDIIVSGDVEGTIVNYRVELENLQSQINTSNVAFNNRITNVEQTKASIDYVDNKHDMLIPRISQVEQYKVERTELETAKQQLQNEINQIKNDKVSNSDFSSAIMDVNERFREVEEDKANADEVYTKTQTDTKIAKKVDTTYLTSNYYNKDEVKSMLNFSISSLVFKIVDELPTENINPVAIYLVPHGYEYTEYIYIEGKWEMLGSTSINISDYATKEYVDSKIESSITTALEGDY